VQDANDGRQQQFLESLAAGWAPHRHVRGPVVVAVSGGGDSVALLRGLHQLLAADFPQSAETGRRGEQALGVPGSQRLVVAHARHDLREGHPGDPAASDAAFVRQLADILSLPYEEAFLEVRQAAEGGEGLEAAARRLRYGFLQETAEAYGARLVVTAHSADDQVETVLHRLLRGTGLAGLAGIAPVRSLVEGIVVVRPMLTLTAQAARDYLRALEQPWQEDATNADTRYARNLIRQELLPRMSAGPYPAVREAMLRLADQAADAHATSTAACLALLEAYGTEEPSGTVLLKTGPLATFPSQLLADMVATLWRQQGWPQRDMTSRHYAAVAAILANSAGNPARLDLPGGLRADTVANGQVRLGPTGLRPHLAPQPHL